MERSKGLTRNQSDNKRLWDLYEAQWSPSRHIIAEDPKIRAQGKSLEVLGDEWGTARSIDHILGLFLKPYLSPWSNVCEIGSGGGRIARRVAPLVAHLTCSDVSQRMLERCRKTLSSLANVSFLDLSSGLPPSEVPIFDLVFSFDVFVHLDLHTMWRLIQEISSSLNAGGVVVLHTSNLLTREGWKRFSRQSEYELASFFFVTPEVVKLFLHHAGFELLKESIEDEADFYLSRDYVVVARKSVISR